MMMKLMKVLVVALAAGGVFAPVASQAGEVDGKAIMCEVKLDYLTKEPWSNERKAEGLHLYAWVLIKEGKHIHLNTREPPRITKRSNPISYSTTATEIEWGVNAGHRLDRRTLELESQYLGGSCELIDPGAIEAYFQPYIDYGNALDAKMREGNKI